MVARLSPCMLNCCLFVSREQQDSICLQCVKNLSPASLYEKEMEEQTNKRLCESVRHLTLAPDPQLLASPFNSRVSRSLLPQRIAVHSAASSMLADK